MLEKEKKFFNELNLLEPDYVAKRMWNDIKNENYKILLWLEWIAKEVVLNKKELC